MNISEGEARERWWHMAFNESAPITMTAAQSANNLKPNPIYFCPDYGLSGHQYKTPHHFDSFFIIELSRHRLPMPLTKAEGFGHFGRLIIMQYVRMPGRVREGDDIITIELNYFFELSESKGYFCDSRVFGVLIDHHQKIPILNEKDDGECPRSFRFHIFNLIPYQKSFPIKIEHLPRVSPGTYSGENYFFTHGFWFPTNMNQPWNRLAKALSTYHFFGNERNERSMSLAWRSPTLFLKKLLYLPLALIRSYQKRRK